MPPTPTESCCYRILLVIVSVVFYYFFPGNYRNNITCSTGRTAAQNPNLRNNARPALRQSS